jgi:hypothetical protein
VDRFASKNDDHAGKTSQRDRDLRGNAKSFSRLLYRMSSAVGGEVGKNIFQSGFQALWFCSDADLN